MNKDEITSLLENTSKEDVQNLVEYLKIQKAENYAIRMGKDNESIVKAYLDKLSELDPELAKFYPNNPSGKTVKDCMQYLEDLALKQVKEKRGIQCVKMNSFEVFDLAVTYFMDNSITKFEKKVAPKPAASATKTKKQQIAELEAEKQKWMQQNAADVEKWEVEHNAKIDAFEKEHAMDMFPPENKLLKEVNPFLDKKFPKQEQLDKLLAEDTSAEQEPEATVAPLNSAEPVLETPDTSEDSENDPDPDEDMNDLTFDEEE